MLQQSLSTELEGEVDNRQTSGTRGSYPNPDIS